MLELSSFQLETTRSLRTAAAVVLNVTPDHMDRYAIRRGVRRREGAHLRALRRRRDQPRRPRRCGRCRYRAPRVLGFSLRADPAADYYVHATRRGRCADARRERLVAMSELKIAGLHNAANALAALAMCDALRLPREAVRAGAARVSRAAASLAVGRRRARRALRRRFEGHERRRDARGRRRHAGLAGADRRRTGQRPGLRAARRSASATRCGTSC